jgi:beta-galactosidase
VTSFLDHEIGAIRAHSDAPVTTNLHGTGTFVDDYQLAQRLDFVSFDNYPFIDGSPKDLEQIIASGWEGDRMRGLLGKPWLLLESCPSQPQYMPHMRAKRPGTHRLMSLQHVAHGSEGVCCFQWRAGRGGMEKMHGAICMGDAPEHTRVFGEVCAIGRDLRNLGALRESDIQAEAVIVWDVHGQWHFDYNNGLRGVADPRARALRFYRSLWEANIPVDVKTPQCDLSAYKLILLPGVFMIPDGLAEGLRDAVAAGAAVLADCLTGWLDADHKWLPGGRLGPLLRELFGVRPEEFDCLRQDERVALQSNGELLPEVCAAMEICDLFHAESAEVLARYKGAFYADQPVLTRKTTGKGEAWYLGATLEPEACATLLLRLCRRLQINPVLPNVPAGAQVRKRKGPDGEWLFASNYTDKTVTITLEKPAVDLLANDKTPSAEITLAPFDARVFHTGS